MCVCVCVCVRVRVRVRVRVSNECEADGSHAMAANFGMVYVKLLHHVHIRESVDSLCRDGADTKKKMEKSAVWVMTLAVYFSYFESLVGYTNALRSRPGTYKGLELQHSGVAKDFVCIG